MQQIIDGIDKQKSNIIRLAEQLVNIPTINPPGINYVRIIDFLEKECKKAGLLTKRYQVPAVELRKMGVSEGDSRISLVARWNNNSNKTLHINAHYDVVPATAHWKTDPFKAVVKAGKLFGRGSEDMKANIACMIYAVAVLKQLKITPPLNLELSFTPDEETGGRPGLAYLLKKGFVKADYALGEGCDGDYVAVGNKGMLWFEVEVYGKSVHASIPQRGENAFDNMLAVVEQLKKLHKVLKARKTRFNTRDKADAYSTMVIGGKAVGGKKINIVPDRFLFSIDRRLNPEENIRGAKKEIERIVALAKKKNKKLKIKVTIATQDEPVISPRDEHFNEVFSCAVSKVLNKKIKTAIMPGGNDLRFFVQRGVPSLGYSVRGRERAHADDEFVFCRSIIETTKIFALVMANLGKKNYFCQLGKNKERSM
ncbi:MAG: ArgE/DapE family deacylase [Candidatus Omnitrophica bacterium]|nr:ArgE/DapE family deacylase [Candidatus Omnitrophota bacterium]